MSISRSWLTAAGLGAALLAAGCSSSGGSGTSPGAGSATTVAIRNVSGTGHVLVDARGRTLYTSDQEKAAGKVLCSTSDCTAIWTPLTLDTGKQPSGPAGVTSQLSVVKRPDGTRQVAFKGGPLYTFSFDHAAGDVHGEGQQDSFGGTHFTWHAAVTAGSTSGGGNGRTTPGYGY